MVHYLTLDLRCGGFRLEIICLQPSLGGHSGTTFFNGTSIFLHNTFEILFCELAIIVFFFNVS